MFKITLLILFVLSLLSFSPSLTQATLWAEKQEPYQSQSNYCEDFEIVDGEFDWDSYNYVTGEGSIVDFKNLLLNYEQKVAEYTIFENEIGVLYYKNMILSLKLVCANRFGYPSVESNEYKMLKTESNNLSVKLNKKISRCNYRWE